MLGFVLGIKTLVSHESANCLLDYPLYEKAYCQEGRSFGRSSVGCMPLKITIELSKEPSINMHLMIETQSLFLGITLKAWTSSTIIIIFPGWIRLIINPILSIF